MGQNDTQPPAKNSSGGLQPSDFVHLHNHTHYSLLDGLQKVPEMHDRVQELGMEAVAITDHGTLTGAIEHYKAGQARGIKPIIGIETYVAPRKHTDKEGKQDANPFHLILLAMNNTGYENLMRLASIACLDGFYYKARIDHDLIEQYQEGLIALSGCIGGEVGSNLRTGQYDKAKEFALWYKGVFGDRYYLEVQDHGYEWEEQGKVNDQLFKLGAEIDVPVVVTSDAHYLLPEDQDAHEALLCVQTGSQLSDEKRMSLTETHLHLAGPQSIIERWKDHPEVVSNTKAIADRCEVELDLGGILIPKFETPDGQSEKDYLHQLTYQGLAWRYLDKPKTEAAKLSIEEVKQLVDQEKLDRLEYELGVIDSMGFNGYFLIVQDFINWGKDQGIIFGPGRGSAAGSIVAYSLSITDLDPLEYDLLFERFLNPDRISMPDIDIDIQDTRRDEVIQYTADKYGHDRVANIVTFGKMAARNAIRDVARVLGVSYADADRLAKMVPPPVQGRHIPLKTSLQDVAELKAEYENNPQSQQVFDLAVRLEGTIRSHGVHAAGVVIAPDEIVKFVPLEMAQKGVVSTQYSMDPVEELGLLKMDFLGLSNLTIIKNALRIIKKVYKTDIDLTKLPLDDEKAYELFSRGDTTGVFQVESAGMKRYLRQLKPNRFEDIIAMVALYRPGPMQFIDSFINRKHGQERIDYMHPKMKGALENTYGILVYQEQVMQIAREMCGFTGGQADTLRKAIGKKKADLMAKMKVEFIDGGIESSGADREMMETLWKQLEDFAAYCFNKSHAACYALIAYQTAYLKAHYPSAFMAALMTSDYGDTDRIAIELTECRHMGIETLPPDVNESFVEFAVRPKDDAIRFGMSAVKNVGIGAVEKLLEAREDGPFTSVEDFAKRVSTREFNRKAWESLAKAGGFDNLEPDRGKLLFNLDKILAFANKVQKEAANGQTDLFGGDTTDESLLPTLHMDTPNEKVADREQLQWERELLGLYLSHHPLDDYEAWLADYVTPLGEITTQDEGKKATVGGLVTAVRKIVTKNGANMAFVKIEDKSGELELIVFPKSFEDTQELWEVDTVVKVKGKVNTKDRDGKVGAELKIMVDEAKEVDYESAKNHTPIGGQKPAKPKPQRPSIAQAAPPRPDNIPTSASPAPPATATAVATKPRRLVITVPDNCDSGALLSIKEVLSRHRGDSEVSVRIGSQEIRLPFKVDAANGIKDHLEEIQAVETVAVSG